MMALAVRLMWCLLWLHVGCPRVAGPITSAALGVLFASRKGAGHRKLGYPQFLKALGSLAEESGADVWGAAAELQARYRQQQREAREQQQAQLLATGAGGQVRSVCISK